MKEILKIAAISAVVFFAMNYFQIGTGKESDK